ncbi:MAG TPA: hypothetical protein VLG40_03875 [Candidatus Saccharimonas sp.]|nr:hypothetical protein [Candidatus Saccharimonas sp.]
MTSAFSDETEWAKAVRTDIEQLESVILDVTRPDTRETVHQFHPFNDVARCLRAVINRTPRYIGNPTSWGRAFNTEECGIWQVHYEFAEKATELGQALHDVLSELDFEAIAKVDVCHSTKDEPPWFNIVLTLKQCP